MRIPLYLKLSNQIRDILDGQPTCESLAAIATALLSVCEQTSNASESLARNYYALIAQYLETLDDNKIKTTAIKYIEELEV